MLKLSKIISITVLLLFNSICYSDDVNNFIKIKSMQEIGLYEFYKLGHDTEREMRPFFLKGNSKPAYYSFNYFSMNFLSYFRTSRLSLLENKKSNDDLLNELKLIDNFNNFLNDEKGRVFEQFLNQTDVKAIGVGFLVALRTLEENSIGKSDDINDLRIKLFKKLSFYFMSSDNSKDFYTFLFFFDYIFVNRFPVEISLQAAQILNSYSSNDQSEKEALSHFYHGMLYYIFKNGSMERIENPFNDVDQIKLDIAKRLKIYLNNYPFNENKASVYEYLINNDLTSFFDLALMKKEMISYKYESNSISLVRYLVEMTKLFMVDFGFFLFLFIALYLIAFCNKKYSGHKNIKQIFKELFFGDNVSWYIHIANKGLPFYLGMVFESVFFRDLF